jgi:hypothetical protein
MAGQGNVGFGYRFIYHRERDRTHCVPEVGFARSPSRTRGTPSG